MSSTDGLLAALLNIISLGAGYAYCGRIFQAAVTLVLSLLLFFLLSYLAAFSPWFVVFGGAFVLCVFIAVACDSFRAALRPMLKPHLIYTTVYVLLFFIGLKFLVLPARRVIFNVIQTNHMEPTFIRGDHFALDRDFNNYKAGDLVVAEKEDQSLIVRRIQEINGAAAILTTDNNVHKQSEAIALTAIHGKVVYVLYSLDPDSWTFQWNRLLLRVN